MPQTHKSLGTVSMDNKVEMNRLTAISNAKIFDGENKIDAKTVVFNGECIQAVGAEIPEGATIIDAEGKTLLPGLIDSHVHTDMEGLRDALKFGVTTELEMMGHWSARKRKEISRRHDVADVRSPGMGVTPTGGHPTQYMKSSSSLALRFLQLFYRFPFVKNSEEAVKFVAKQVQGGADYVKIFIEDGSCVGYPGLPVLDDETLCAAIGEAHRLNRLTIVHATTAEGVQRAINAGIDGLGHLFFDRSPTPKLVADIASSGAFIIPTLVTLSTAFGKSAAWLAADERVSKRLSKRMPRSEPYGMLASTFWPVPMSRSLFPFLADSPTASACTTSCNC